ncbi:MAG: hypothetical protein IJX32_05040 [Spirochaetaceae bacterium]|nr:hypothetical protein [Spirochaetaceae bacterium]
MKRIEIIFSQALREDLLEWIEAASKDLSPKPMYTLIPEVLGKGNSNPKMNDAVWPEVNEIIIIYTENDEFQKYVEEGVKKLQEQYPREGIAFFVMG